MWPFCAIGRRRRRQERVVEAEERDPTREPTDLAPRGLDLSWGLVETPWPAANMEDGGEARFGDATQGASPEAIAVVEDGVGRENPKATLFEKDSVRPVVEADSPTTASLAATTTRGLQARTKKQDMSY